MPSYVANADASNIGEHGGVYNRGGRGYPDVSANGAYLLTFVNATEATFFGTSLASPIFASVITLINEERTAAGKGVLYLNKHVIVVVYEHGHMRLLLEILSSARRS
jgi:tripeptidyl-peptidase-1